MAVGSTNKSGGTTQTAGVPPQAQANAALAAKLRAYAADLTNAPLRGASGIIRFDTSDLEAVAARIESGDVGLSGLREITKRHLSEWGVLKTGDGAANLGQDIVNKLREVRLARASQKPADPSSALPDGSDPRWHRDSAQFAGRGPSGVAPAPLSPDQVLPRALPAGELVVAHFGRFVYLRSLDGFVPNTAFPVDADRPALRDGTHYKVRDGQIIPLSNGREDRAIKATPMTGGQAAWGGAAAGVAFAARSMGEMAAQPLQPIFDMQMLSLAAMDKLAGELVALAQGRMSLDDIASKLKQNAEAISYCIARLRREVPPEILQSYALEAMVAAIVLMVPTEGRGVVAVTNITKKISRAFLDLPREIVPLITRFLAAFEKRLGFRLAVAGAAGSEFDVAAARVFAAVGKASGGAGARPLGVSETALLEHLSAIFKKAQAIDRLWVPSELPVRLSMIVSDYQVAMPKVMLLRSFPDGGYLGTCVARRTSDNRLFVLAVHQTGTQFTTEATVKMIAEVPDDMAKQLQIYMSTSGHYTDDVMKAFFGQILPVGSS